MSNNLEALFRKLAVVSESRGSLATAMVNHRGKDLPHIDEIADHFTVDEMDDDDLDVFLDQIDRQLSLYGIPDALLQTPPTPEEHEFVKSQLPATFSRLFPLNYQNWRPNDPVVQIVHAGKTCILKSTEPTNGFSVELDDTFYVQKEDALADSAVLACKLYGIPYTLWEGSSFEEETKPFLQFPFCRALADSSEHFESDKLTYKREFLVTYYTAVCLNFHTRLCERIWDSLSWKYKPDELRSNPSLASILNRLRAKTGPRPLISHTPATYLAHFLMNSYTPSSKRNSSASTSSRVSSQWRIEYAESITDPRRRELFLRAFDSVSNDKPFLSKLWSVARA